MGVNNEDYLRVAIDSGDVASTPTGFLEIVNDDLPVFHETWMKIAIAL